MIFGERSENAGGQRLDTATFLRKAGATIFFKLLNSNIHDDHSVDPPTDDVNTVHDELLDFEITEDEARKAIRRLKSGKTAGVDQVINELLKSTERVILPFSVKLCNAIFNQDIFPEEWTKSIIVPLHKKGDCDNPDNYRGISLLSSLNKVFTSVLNARLTEWAEENTVFTEAQAGFRKAHRLSALRSFQPELPVTARPSQRRQMQNVNLREMYVLRL